MNNSMTSFELAALVANVAEDRKAKDTMMLKTEQVSTLADFFVIASVESRAQMRAIADHLVKAIKELNLNHVGLELDKEGRWTLLDFGDVVVHLFNHEDRKHYNLERFWNHATEVPRHQWVNPALQAS